MLLMFSFSVYHFSRSEQEVWKWLQWFQKGLGSTQQISREVLIIWLSIPMSQKAKHYLDLNIFSHEQSLWHVISVDYIMRKIHCQIRMLRKPMPDKDVKKATAR